MAKLAASLWPCLWPACGHKHGQPPARPAGGSMSTEYVARLVAHFVTRG